MEEVEGFHHVILPILPIVTRMGSLRMMAQSNWRKTLTCAPKTSSTGTDEDALDLPQEKEDGGGESTPTDLLVF